MYKAIKEIGGYKIGDIVPDDKARVWLAQYAVPHVKEGAQDNSTKTIESKRPMVEQKESYDALLDDYLNRNNFVVVKNIRKDSLSKDQVRKMIALEENAKKRDAVLTALRAK